MVVFERKPDERRIFTTAFKRGSVAAVCAATLTLLGAERAPRNSASDELLSGESLVGSTIVSILPPGFQPSLIYKKFPPDELVGPSDVWQIGFGASLAGAPSTLPVTLRLAIPGQPPGVQISDDQAVFVSGDGLRHNYDPAERFEITYTGSLDPFVGPIDFVLAPAGMPEIPIRVHLGVTEKTGFPVAIAANTFSLSPVANIIGDGGVEVLLAASAGGTMGLHAFDHQGNSLPGWPVVDEAPGVLSHSFSTPNLADLDHDGHAEIVVTGTLQRELFSQREPEGFELVQTLSVFDGSGTRRWQTEGDFESYPAIGDMDGDGDLDIVVGAAGNLRRYESDGTPVAGWQVEAGNVITVEFPVIADIDGDPSNGMELAADAKVFGPQSHSEISVWNEDGSLHGSMWPRVLPIAAKPLTVVDLDSDPGNGLEVILAVDNGTNPPVDPTTGFLQTFTVHAWHADGSVVAGWPHRFLRDPAAGFFDDRVVSGCSAGDVDGDGDVEIVVGTYGQFEPANGNLFLFHHDGTLDPNWPRWAGIAQTPSAWGGPALGDLDGDGALEIVTASFKGVYAFRGNGELVEGFPKMSHDVFTQPVIADLNADGIVEIVQTTLFDGLLVWSMAGPGTDPRPWPQFRQNPGNTGSLPVPPSASAIGLVAGLRFVDETSMFWNAATGASVHDVMRGSLGALLANQSVGDAACIGDDRGETTLLDSITPAAGTGFYYIVRGDRSGTPPGSYDDPPGGGQEGGRDSDVGSMGGAPCTHVH